VAAAPPTPGSRSTGQERYNVPMRYPRSRASRLLARTLAGALLAVPMATVIDLPGPPELPEVTQVAEEVADGLLRTGVARRLDVDGGPELIALTWDPGSEAGFEIRARDGAGWSEWHLLEGAADEAPDAGAEESDDRGYAGPAFLGRDIEEIELRARDAVPTGLVVHGIDSEPASVEGLAGAAVAQPPELFTRSQWGADESWRDDSGGDCDGIPDYVDDIRIGVVHHTVSSNTYTPQETPAILRGIYDFHVHTRGYCDIAYNFFVDRHGQVFEGRYGGIRRAVIGGHTSGFNSVSTGVAVIGDFRTDAVPQAAYNSLVEILAFKLGYHGVDPKGRSTVTVGSNSSAKWPEGTVVQLDNIEGHGDSNNTECPGAQLHGRLPQLRNDVAAMISSRQYQPAFTLDRLAGADRFDTAATVARSTFATASEAYLARGDGATSFADALAAGFMAGVKGVPILLSTHGDVPDTTIGALRALGVRTVHVLGGDDALSPQVDAELRGAGFTVERIVGADRFETAASIARAGAGSLGTDAAGRRVAVLSSGRSFPDALASGGIVYGMRFPQLLSEQSGLPAATASALSDLGIQHVLITGGDLALSPAVEQQVNARGITSERVAGATRWDTSIALADLAIDRFGYTAGHVEVATGDNFPDALAGGPHAGRSRSPVVLTGRTAVPDSVCAFLRRRGGGVGSGHLFGGRTAVDSGTKFWLEECLKPPA
jgi:putative cell wall-binding protein